MWVVGDVARDSQSAVDGRVVQHLVSLLSVEDDATGEQLEVVWEIEPATRVIERLRARGVAVSAQAVCGPAFWQTVEIEESEDLLRQSRGALSATAPQAPAVSEASSTAAEASR